MYDSYRIGLRQQGALDFDDLMILPLHILLNNRDILESERARIEWTLVDEYQDVNIPQYTLLRTLVGDSGRLMVVGDPDQSIYGWRGSDMSLILNFESDFRGARAITLDRNYRSTTNILASANSVIQNNNERHDKKLWTNAEGGAPVQVMLSLRDIDDFKFITNEISHLVFEDGYEYSDIGILYRMNALSRGYEQALLENGIHYSIVRGVSYYDRKEVKDVLSMLRLSVNPHDEASLSRIVNVPKRGLGEKSAAELGRYLATACGDPRRIWEEIKLNPPLKGKAGAGASKLAEIMLGIAEEKSLEGAVNFILYNAGYEEYIREEYPDDWEDRLQNAREFISIIPESGSVSEALAQAALFTDHDAADTRNSGVSLMTLHAAKGLEFPVVFLVGLEENIFPSERSKFNPGGIEEERRLCYVGMTRARERLYITGVVNRLLFGAFRRSNFSRFISELPDTVTIVDRTKNGSGKDVHGGSDRRGWRW
jgi:DNA helicase-2/ATP-dependent DNA helicase PcrA